MSAESAASKTIAALKRGDAEVILSLPAIIGDKFHALFPGLTADILSWVNRFLPKADGIGSDRTQGKDTHSSLSPSVLTTASNKAAVQNNEMANGEQETAQQQNDVQVVQTETLPEVNACLSDIQDTMGVPWKPANWRNYATYPEVMQLFWQRLKPAVETEAFLRNSIAIAERAYLEVNRWYQPSSQINLSPSERQHIQRELNAFTFGNPQLLIQQIALSRALQGEVVGRDGTEPRHGASPYRHPEIQLLDEQAVEKRSPQLQQVYQDIKQTLGLTVVNSDYQALAKWPDFFLPAWEDVKQWRQHQEYRTLEQQLIDTADDAVNRLHPKVVIGEQEIRDLLNDPGDFENLQQMVQMFSQLLPGLILNVAMFHRGVANQLKERV